MTGPKMSRRQFVSATAAGAVGMLLPGTSWGSVPNGKARRPNIVLVMADDMGWGDLRAMGANDFVQTPHLDEMAASGVRFTRFYATSPQCSPSRCAFLTGRHPSRYGCWAAGSGGLPNAEITMAEALSKAGYATGHFGKWHVGGSPMRQGYDTEYWIANSYQVHKMDVTFKRQGKPEKSAGYCETAVMDEALAFIERNAAGKKPFLATVWNLAPHSPSLAPEECCRPYAKLPEKNRQYWGMITAIDREIGRLRKTLKDLGIADNTLLLFTSDNGAVKYSRPYQPFREGKGSLREGGLMVPGIIEWPDRVPKPSVCDQPVNLLDLFPTVLEVAGAKMPKTIGPLDGVSLIPLLDGDWKSRPKPMGFHFLNQRWESAITRKPDFLNQTGKVGFAVVDGRHKLYTNLKGEAPQLYDVVADRGEKTDLAGQQPDLVKRLEDWRRKWWASVMQDQKKHGIAADPATLQPLPPTRKRGGGKKR